MSRSLKTPDLIQILSPALTLSLALVLALLLSSATLAQAQLRSSIQISPETPRAIMVEQLQGGYVTPVAVAPTQQPQAPAPVPAAMPGTPQETSLLMPVQFGFDSDRLTLEARSILSIVAQAMNDPELRSSRFLLEGHTDATGTWQYNAGLSQRRAASVAQYLAQQGVSLERLMIVGYSWNRLLPGHQPADHRHRRVEIGRLR